MPSDGCIVTLTTHEVLLSHFAACQRITAGEAQRLNHASTYCRGIRTRIDEESVGAIGERAFAKWKGLYSEAINTFHDVPDCGSVYEIRSTALRHGKLIVRDNDDDLRVFVLALVGLDGRVILRGWMHGWEAKRAEWGFDPHGHRPAWGVPQESLHPMDTLP